MGVERHRQRRGERQTEAWKLRVQGWTQARIAEHLGVSQQTVSNDLRRTEKRLYAEFVVQAEEIKARQTAQLDHLYAEALSQWEKLCEEQAPCPALLEKAMRALTDIRAIWGLNAPVRQEVSGPDGAAIAIDVEATRGELQRRLSRLAATSGAEGFPGELVSCGDGVAEARLAILAPGESGAAAG